MSRFRLKAPSPALVIATAALFVALGGSSYAVFKVGTKNIKNGSVTTAKLHNGAVTNKKIANGAVTRNKINTTGLTVPNALHANNASAAGSSTFANTAGSAQPVAFAQVTSAGALVPANTKNVGFATVDTLNSAIFCIGGAPFTVRGAQATIDERASGFQSDQVGLGTITGCPASTQAFVLTTTGSTEGAAGFFIQLYG
jgi:hypothetical protein